MKILHITDTHGTAKSPSGRIDTYYVSFLRKLYELGIVIKKQNIDLVLHTGDLFHTPNVSDKFAGQVAELFKSWNVPIYVVPGNHDIEGYSMDSLDQTKLGLFAKSGVINILDRNNPFVFEKDNIKVAISGQEYYADIDVDPIANRDYEMQQPLADFNILCAHGYIADTKQFEGIKHTLANAISTDADVILSGHYHRQFMYESDTYSVYNPGSLMRVEHTSYNLKHIPQYGILDIDIDNGDIVYDYEFKELRTALPAEKIFDINAKVLDKQKQLSIDSFKDAISNAVVNITSTSASITDEINNFCLNNNIEAELRLGFISDFTNSVNTNKASSVDANFIVDPKSDIRIKSIILNGFQGHENSTVEFEDGLNVICGESNSGKTSIIRSLLWVLDNNPKGTSFITTGNDFCSVVVNFTNGSYISKSKGTDGSVKCEIFDSSTGNTTHYDGSDVPIKGYIVSQMPLVIINGDKHHLNISTQMDGPFLIGENPSGRAKTLGLLSNTYLYDEFISIETEEKKKATRAFNEHEKNKNDLEYRLSQLKEPSFYKDIVDDLTAIDAKYHFKERLISLIDNDIRQANTDIAKYESDIDKANLIDQDDIEFITLNVSDKITLADTIGQIISLNESERSVMKDMKKLVAISSIDTRAIDDVSNKITFIEDYTKNKEDIINFEKEVNSLDAKIDCANDLIAIYEKLSVLTDLRDRMDQWKVEFDHETMAYNRAKVKHNKATVDLSNAVLSMLEDDICPCCGQSITSEGAKKHAISYIGGNHE